ncbi:MAG: electron transfer flavoprotein subunit alpha/FixB family protein [Deltaproteobacteria bacterium]|nr:MAG: electron transfer flavoprotein subunit alpha/FixB family protein [Deltaproteobacteria bacterium]
MNDILVVAEHRKGELRDITFEMLALAKRLAREQGGAVTTVLLGEEILALQEELSSLTDKILVVEDPLLGNYNADPYLVVLKELISRDTPYITLLGHTAMGMDLAPPLSARTGIPLVTDCIDVMIEESHLSVQRQVYGGKVNAHLQLKPAEQYILTIRPGSFTYQEEWDSSATVTKLPAPSWDALRGRRFIGYLEPEAEDVDISEADILVSIGRGIGKPENIAVAEAFAEAIGATLSCSRPVADKGWLPKSRQVGTSGKTVRPKVYIALGISGAFQHQAGMKNSGTIIAVNKDPKAPIFKVAHYGIVADLFQVLPVLTEKFKKQ